MDRDLIVRRVVWVALCALVLVAYSGVLDAPFVYDDKVEVAGNRALRLFAHLDGDALSLLLAGRGDVGGLDDVVEGWRAILAYNAARPLLLTSYAIDFQRGGLDPRPYHITNLLVHGAAIGAALALVQALGRLARRPLPAPAAGLLVGLWALHPMATEAVAYTTGRSESLCGAFSFLALTAWAGAIEAESAGRSGLWGRGLGTLCFGLAVGSKEPGVMVFPAMLWMELLFREGRAVRWWSYAPHLAAVAGAVALRLSVTGGLLPVEVPRPLAVQVTTSAEVLLRYLQLWALPVGQTLFHDQPDVDPASLRGALAWGGALLVVGIGSWAARGRPLVAFGLGAAALFLVPSTSVVMLKEHMAEHRAYVTGLYLLVAAAGLLPVAWGRRGQAAVAVGVLLLGGATWARNRVWVSEIALWREATEARPTSDEAWYGLGDALRFANDCSAAVPAYAEALELNPQYLDAYTNLGICKAQLGDVAAARAAWRAALRERPSYCKAHANLGSLAYRLQEWEEAEVELRSALAYCPENAVAHWLLGNLYYGPRRDRTRALRHYEELVRLHPQFDHAPKAKERILELTW